MAYRNATPKTWYQIRGDEGWSTCRFAEVRPDGSLQFELPDGTKGTAQPGAWRVKPKPSKLRKYAYQNKRR